MADDEDGSYVCPACGGLVLKARRRAHETQWCPELAASSEEEEGEDTGSISMEVKALISPQYSASMPVELSFEPKAPLIFSQEISESPCAHERHRDEATGGQLWWSELVLAEFLAMSGRGPTPASSPGVALSLGCGAAPVSAYIAAALGWQVLCTDLPEVLPMTQRNFESNKKSLDVMHMALRDAGVAKESGRGSMDFLPLPFGEEVPEETWAWVESRGGVQLVLCSDCIWQAHRHRALAVTLNNLLRTQGSEALIAYQARQMAELQFFGTIEHYNLRSERLEAVGAVRRAHFPPQFANRANPECSFFVHRVWRPAPSAQE